MSSSTTTVAPPAHATRTVAPITPEAPGQITVLIVDTFTLSAGILRSALANDDKITVIDDVATLDNVMEVRSLVDPSVVLLHVEQVDGRAIDAIANLVNAEECAPNGAAGRTAPVVLVADVDDPRMCGLAIAAGASGYLTTDAAADELAKAISFAVRGTTAMSGPQVTKMIRHLINRGTDVDCFHPYATLTRREIEVLGFLVDGLSTAQISDQLSISQHTARAHIQNVLVKLNVHSRLQAAAHAVQHHLL